MPIFTVPLLEHNPYHEPAGSSKGGQFASKPGGALPVQRPYIQSGEFLDKLMNRYGPDWPSELVKLHQKGLLPGLLDPESGRTGMIKLRQPELSEYSEPDRSEALAQARVLAKKTEGHSDTPGDQAGGHFQVDVSGGTHHHHLERKGSPFQQWLATDLDPSASVEQLEAVHKQLYANNYGYRHKKANALISYIDKLIAQKLKARRKS